MNALNHFRLSTSRSSNGSRSRQPSPSATLGPPSASKSPAPHHNSLPEPSDDASDPSRRHRRRHSQVDVEDSASDVISVHSSQSSLFAITPNTRKRMKVQAQVATRDLNLNPALLEGITEVVFKVWVIFMQYY